VFHRELYRTVPILLILWCYAFLTGFSSSVCRAVTMFTIFSLALLIDQRTHPLNCLLVSLFLILVIDPWRITDVGLQLSYCAMGGIVTLYPWLRSLPGKRISNRFFRWAWEATALSISAQVSTAPLVVFYFHQLPVYALFTNLIAIPLLSLLIGLFVLTLPLLSLNLLTHAVSWIMNVTAMLMNQAMEVIAGVPGAVLRHLNLDRITLCMLLITWILGAMAVRERVRWPRYGLMLSVTVLLSWGSISAWMDRSRTSLIITHFNRGSQVIFSQGHWVDCYCLGKDSLTRERMVQYLLSAPEYSGHTICRMDVHHFEASRGRISACHPVSKGCWMVGNDLLRGMIITGIRGQWLPEVLQHDPATFIILHDNPEIPSRAMKSLSNSADIIADGSNSKWYSDKMQSSLPLLHATSRLGAYRRTW
jgi:ComEC/Rec2-related protein